MSTNQNPSIPCFLCGKSLSVKKSKSNKPYFICEICGLQTFVRYKAGIESFRKLLATMSEDGDKYLSVNKSSFEVLSLVSRLNELKEQLDRIEENKSLSEHILGGTESELAEKALKKEIKSVRRALQGGSAN